MMPRFWPSVSVNLTGNMLVENESVFRAASKSIEDFSSGSNLTSPTHSGLVLGMKVKTFVWVCIVVSATVFQINIRRDGMKTSWRKIQRIMTGNFDPRRKLGGGGFGSVYEGVLVDGTRVAMKRLDRLGQGRKEFAAEVKTLGSIHHVNLVKLIGFCDENAHSLLVYEHTRMDDANGEELEKIVKIAIFCLHEDPTRRPSMSTVVKAIEGEMSMLVMELESFYHQLNHSGNTTHPQF
ncbi:hypothetical protein V2J09_003572 [Rumex salicifolius]